MLTLLLASGLASGSTIAVQVDGAGGADLVGLGFAADGSLVVGGEGFGRITLGDRTLQPGGHPDQRQVFAARVAPDGRVAWVTRVDATDLSGVAVAADGTVALVGKSDQEAVVAVLAPDGTVRSRWSAHSTDRIWATAAAFDGSGRLWVGGGFAGTVRIGADPRSSAAGEHVPSEDAWVARFEGGRPTWVTSFGGAGDDTVQAIAAGPDQIAVAAELGGPTVIGDRSVPGPPASSFTRIYNPSTGLLVVYALDGSVRGTGAFGAHDRVDARTLGHRPDGTWIVAADDQGFADPQKPDAQPALTWFDPTGRPLGHRDLEAASGGTVVDLEVWTASATAAGLTFARSDDARSTALPPFPRPTGSRIEPVGFARAPDGRVAFAARVGDLVETPRSDGTVDVSTARQDSVVVMGAWEALGTRSELYR